MQRTGLVEYRLMVYVYIYACFLIQNSLYVYAGIEVFAGKMGQLTVVV